ncbi:MAG: CBS domain-containing protein [Candidatus Caldatribacteriaceae bacterium]
MLVEEIMLPEIISVNDFDPIRDVLQFLARRKIQEVVVVDLEQRPLGYFFIKSFFKQLMDEAQRGVAPTGNIFATIREKMKDFAEREVSEFMEKKFNYLEADESVEDLLDLFLHTEMEFVPVVKEGKVTGVVSRVRFLQFLLENK